MTSKHLIPALLAAATLSVVTAAGTETNNTTAPVVAEAAPQTVLQSHAVVLSQNTTPATLEELLESPTLEEQGESYCAALTAPHYDGVLMVCDTAVNLRTAPEDGTVLRLIDNGRLAHLVSQQNGWYKIVFDNTTGYVKADWCRLVVYEDYVQGENEIHEAEEQAAIAAEAAEQARIAAAAEAKASGTDVASAATTAVSADVAAILETAKSWIGTPYSYGGSSKSGTDCSGFVMAVFSQYGISLPHGASGQYEKCRSVTTAERQAGDLVFFSTCGNYIGHVGIYLGDGNFVHASTSYGVRIDSVYSTYYANCYVGAGRILS